jgi:hypothetical protein
MIGGGARKQTTLPTHTPLPPMEKPARRGEVWIRQYSDGSKCDVIVSIGDDEMVLQLPDYGAAIKWAQMEAKSRKITARL